MLLSSKWIQGFPQRKAGSPLKNSYSFSDFTLHNNQ